MDITTLGAAMAMAKKVMPQVTAADAGKLATVDSNGKWAAADLEVGQGEVAVDSTLLVSGAAADAKVTGDKVNELKSAINASDYLSIKGNVRIPSEFVYGTLNTDGEIASQSQNYRVSSVQYMSFPYKCVLHVESGYSVIYCTYDNSHNKLTRAIINGAYDIEIDANTIFRVCILLNGTEVPLASMEGISEKAYIKSSLSSSISSIDNSILSIESDIDSVESSIEEIESTLQNITETQYDYEDISNPTFSDSGFIRTSGNLDPVSGYGYYTISVEAGEHYRVSSFCGSNARLWLVKNSSNAVLSYSTDSSEPSTKSEEVTIPENGATLIVNAEVSTQAHQDVISIQIGTPYIAPKTNGHNPLYGKVYCAVGDSITYGEDIDSSGITQSSPIDVYQWSGLNSVWNQVEANFRHSYAYQIAERNNMTFYNGGVSGSTMQGIEEKRGFSLANGRYTLLPDKIDYLTIFFGWNDTAFGTLGTISDSTNGSYYGGFNVVMPYLINKYPDAKIALIVPFGCDAGHREAVRLLGNKWGVAVWDNYNGGTPLYYGKEDSVGVNSSIVTANRAKYQANGAHPNYKGHKQLADMIENFLKGI